MYDQWALGSTPSTGAVLPQPVQNDLGGWDMGSMNPTFVDNTNWKGATYRDTATPIGNKFGWDDPRTQGHLTRDTMRYGFDKTYDMVTNQNIMNRDLMRYNQGQMLNTMGAGFNNTMTGMENLFDQHFKYGGMYGDQSNPQYSPNAGTQNGYGGLFAIAGS